MNRNDWKIEERNGKWLVIYWSGLVYGTYSTKREAETNCPNN